ncbi:tyrosine-protein phosphatase Lar-like [Neocloeon triangulifer]|uniref:tyrosine-protein phosphatase Lar-like n=1 Tax=Neocloeon triangulifer TaxID=2078957 RepID=UPI00286FACA8|nr:tyrosine-protein phosphatase Lar-like [Neocloeon triangulifer]
MHRGALVGALLWACVLTGLAQEPPTVSVHPRDQTVRAGAIASIWCRVTPTEPPPVLSWKKNGKRISNFQSRYLVKEFPAGDGLLLRIDPVRMARDDAVYECVAEAQNGEQTSADASITVLENEKLPGGFPKIGQVPTTKVVELGHATVLACDVTGSPTPLVTWLREMMPLNTSNPRYNILESGTLQISSSEEEDLGKYECIAQNNVGTEYSQPTMLYVKVRRVFPMFTIRPKPLYEVMLGADLNVTCVAVGSPMPHVMWLQGKQEINAHQPVGKNILHLKDIRQSANYTCVALSALGSIEAPAMIKVQALPTAPAVKVLEVGATAVRLAWTYPEEEEIQYYVIQYKPKFANQAFSEISGVITMYYTVRGLSPYTEYELYVIAVNAVGRGVPSDPAVVTTGETGDSSGFGTKPGSAPRNVMVRPLSSSTMVIQWDEPDTPNGQITGYKVFYTTNPGQVMANWQSQMVDNNQLTTISELTPHTIYTIRVQAISNVGPGPLSPPVHVKTQQGVPSQPSNLRATDIGETSFVLHWNRPVHAGENIVSYELYWNDTYAEEKHHRRIPVSESYTLTGLYPNTMYYVWLAARSQRGEGATTSPTPVRTKQYVQGLPPQNLTAVAEGSGAIKVRWKPPPQDKRPGRIYYYKIQVVEHSRPDSEAMTITVNSSKTDVLVDELKKWTDYRVWVTAGSSMGDNSPTSPVVVRTDEDVPGNPQDVRVTPINSTSIRVDWKPPSDKERNGLIRGYHVHVQEIKDESKNLLNEPMRFDVIGGNMETFNVTGLQPDTKYAVQVAALTRKGDGDRSNSVTVHTPGGVPNRPTVNLKILEREPSVTLELEWTRPSQAYGDLLGYRLRYGVKDHENRVEVQKNSHTFTHRIEQLERGVEYEFRVAGQNTIGYGQETVKYLLTPEGPPTGPPVNVTFHFQTPDIVSIHWKPPPKERRNGQLTRYTMLFHKKQEAPIERNITMNKAVFTDLEEHSEYILQVRAHTLQGPGPYSERMTVRTERDIVRAPMSIKAVATSESSVEVWWEAVPSRGKVIGYQIFYTMTAVEDLDEWQHKVVGITESAELTSLEKYAQYALAVAARTKTGLGRLSEKITVKVKPEDVPLNLRAQDVTTHSMTLTWSPPIRLNPINYKISFDASKEFVDSQGITQTQTIPRRTILLEATARSYTINELSPFTTYSVNVSAIPSDRQYTPPTKIAVTTQMAAPQPMVKPDFYGVLNSEEIQVILPQASEEYGPISHYFLIAVPDVPKAPKHPDELLTEKVSANQGMKTEYTLEPYVAAKFPQRNIPYTFHLGNGEAYDGYINRKLQPGKKYRIFVRAVVDTPQKHLYTSSPYSELLSLDMREVPPGEPPRRPNPNVPVETSEVSVNRNLDEAGALWIIGPVIAAIVLAMCLLAGLVVRRQRQPRKMPEHGTVTRPLMTAEPSPVPTGPPVHPHDPVEVRRIQFKTPAMLAHPPVLISHLATHVQALKANDNIKFSQEYESIEPGQQFTWDNSSLEVNKPKNRYANVIAYDHSRVVLQSEHGVPGSDYINANFCDGYRKPNAYIATQGPLADTFAAFWRMVWETKSSSIVMMTRLEERARIKCDQYWPTRGSETYGPITVAVKDTQHLAAFSIRSFTLTKVGSSERREVRQMQFTAWPDHGVPEHPAPFLIFLKRVKALNSSDAGPIIVHCSAGVGRTGCFIVIDSMIERMKHEKSIDIYGHVTCLRAQRNYMVQTEDQYVFIHDALLEHFICGNSEVPARSLHSHLQRLLIAPIAPDQPTGMELEFKKLNNLLADGTRFVTANMMCNKPKNRLVHILPYEATRVCLQPIRGMEGSDYINASFIDGYKYRAAYIATQGPLAHTSEDLWRMLWEHNSTIIVMLTKLKEMGREKCFQYWPNERSVRYDCFVVDPIAEYNMPQYILREFKITDSRDGQSRTIRQFQFVDWPEQGVPKSGEGFIDFIGQVHKTKEQFGQEGPITVHCSGGVGRTGVFIALSIILERMQYEGVVDVFQTVRILRTQRTAMVQTEEQYQFCYRAALEYLGSFDHYTT